jgi:hypothetical protein
MRCLWFLLCVCVFFLSRQCFKKKGAHLWSRSCGGSARIHSWSDSLPRGVRLRYALKCLRRERSFFLASAPSPTISPDIDAVVVVALVAFVRSSKPVLERAKSGVGVFARVEADQLALKDTTESSFDFLDSESAAAAAAAADAASAASATALACFLSLRRRRSTRAVMSVMQAKPLGYRKMLKSREDKKPFIERVLVVNFKSTHLWLQR